jgi:hypothetical protein
MDFVSFNFGKIDDDERPAKRNQPFAAPRPPTLFCILCDYIRELSTVERAQTLAHLTADPFCYLESKSDAPKRMANLEACIAIWRSHTHNAIDLFCEETAKFSCTQTPASLWTTAIDELDVSCVAVDVEHHLLCLFFLSRTNKNEFNFVNYLFAVAD